MKKNYLLLGVLLLHSVLSLAQIDPRNALILGQELGWNLLTNNRFFIPAELVTDHGNSIAAVCDQDGQARIITDGNTVMLGYPNGYGVISNQLKAGFRNQVYVQNTIIIPKPSDPSRYYIVTISGNDPGSLGNGTGLNQGLYYSEIDINNLTMIDQNIPLKAPDGSNIDENYNNMSNAISVTTSPDGINYWLVAGIEQGGNGTTIASYRITNNGIQQYPTSSYYFPNSSAATSLKISAMDSVDKISKIACSGQYGDTFYGTIDNYTGEISKTGTMSGSRSVEFSSDGKTLYALDQYGTIIKYVFDQSDNLTSWTNLDSNSQYKSLQRIATGDIFICNTGSDKNAIIDANTPNSYVDFKSNIGLSYGTASTPLVFFNTCQTSITPTFSIDSEITYGDTTPLPNQSDENINGFWYPPFNNTETATYTFYPYDGQCATPTTMTITVNPVITITPTFNDVALIGNTANYTLPNQSTNFPPIYGSWSPSIITEGDNTYTFTPNAGQNATTVTKSYLLLKQTVIDAVDDDFSSTPIGIDGGQTPSVFNNDSIIFESTPYSENVTVQLLSVDPIDYLNYDSPVINPNGTITIHRNPYQGTITFTYEIISKLCTSSHDTATATLVLGSQGTSRKVQSHAIDKVTVYPNPSAGIFNIDLFGIQEEYDNIEVFNMLGAKVYEGRLLSKGYNAIDLSQMTTGCYIAKVSGKGGSQSFQLIKQ